MARRKEEEMYGRVLRKAENRKGIMEKERKMEQRGQNREQKEYCGEENGKGKEEGGEDGRK